MKINHACQLKELLVSTYNGTAGDDDISPENVTAGVLADPAGSLPGDGNDTIYGYAGDDYLDGGGGNDTINSGGGNDHVEGGAGDDTIVDGSDWDGGHDVIFGRSGNDTITSLWGY